MHVVVIVDLSESSQQCSCVTSSIISLVVFCLVGGVALALLCCCASCHVSATSSPHKLAVEFF